MSNYQRSFEILWVRRQRPTLTHPNNCSMYEDGTGDLGPCWECMHCHWDAYEIETALDRGEDVKL